MSELTVLDVKDRALAGCALMTYLVRYDTTIVDPEPKLLMTLGREGRQFTMQLSRPAVDEQPGCVLGTFEVYATADHPFMTNSPASKYLAQPPNLNPATAEGFQRARDWLLECARDHEQCQQWEKNHGDFMPTRVLWVCSTSEENVTIVNSSKLHGSKPYAALSYCWGDDQACKSIASSLSSPEIAIKNLPLTIQDAIRTTREIGIQYLWVDRFVFFQLQSLMS
jgi:hypothetical protein